MSDLLYKAVNRDYTSRNGLRWGVGVTVTHPTSTGMVRDVPSTYLSLSSEPAETLIGRDWPCRLLRVEPVGEVITSDDFPHKRCVLSARVVDEIEPWRALGPNGQQAAAVIHRCRSMTTDETERLTAARAVAWDAVRAVAGYAAGGAAGAAAGAAARDAAGGAAWDAAGGAAGAAAWDAAGYAAWGAAGGAAGAVVVRDLIAVEQYDLLTASWVSVIGPIENLPVPAWVDEIGSAA